MQMIQRAKQDLQEMEAAVAKLQEEIQELKAFIRLAEKYNSEPGREETSLRQRIVVRLSPDAPKRDRIVTIAKQLLSDGEPRSTRVILAHIKARGETVGGSTEADEVMNLSGYLSREKGIFQTDRIKGWSLKTNDPTSVATQVGSGS